MWKAKKRSRTLSDFNAEKIFLATTQPLKSIYSFFETRPEGLTDEQVEAHRGQYGENVVTHGKRKQPLTIFIRAFINPF